MVTSPLRAQYRRFSYTLRSKQISIKQSNQGRQCRSLILWCSKGVRTIFATSKPYTSLSMKESTRTVPSSFPIRMTTLEASARSHSKTIFSLESRIGQGNTSSSSITLIILRPFLIQTTKEHTIYLTKIRDKMLSLGLAHSWPTLPIRSIRNGVSYSPSSSLACSSQQPYHSAIGVDRTTFTIHTQMKGSN